MRDLDLEGLSEDGRVLVARDITTGETYRIPADHRLSSLIGKPSRPGSTSGQMEIRTTLEQVEHNVKALIQEKHDALELRGEYKHPKAGPRSCMSPDGRAEHKRVFSKAEGE